jgi:hypothetical protein
MDLNDNLLQELSNLFVSDLRASEYYRGLQPPERVDLENRLAHDAINGGRPLLPGASPDQVAKISAQAEIELGVGLPSSLLRVLTVIDGFVENGVALYGIDQDVDDEETGTVPGILAQNLALWATSPETAHKYLFLGDSELWLFAYEIATLDYVALSRSSGRLVQRFSGIEALVNDMLAQALDHFDESPEPSSGSTRPPKAPNLPGTDFSLN